jgi:hypothetical protein
MTSNTPGAIRLVQGLNYALGDREVGVMNVYEEAGTNVAHLSVFDPATSTDDDVHVRHGDELSVGRLRYRVIMVALAHDGDRAWLEIAPQPDPAT